MAITSTPDALNPIERAVLWVGSQTPTADPVETRFGYYLKWNGSRIMEDRSCLPDSGSTPIPLDMKEDLLGLVKTTIPNPAIVGVGQDSSIIGEATLTHGTITIDKSVDPPTVNKTITSDSGPFKVINAGLNVFDQDSLSSVTPTVLSYLPEKMTIHKTTRLWLWFLGSTGITYSWKYNDGTGGSTTGSTASFDASYIPMSPANIGGGIDADRVVEITVTLTAISKTYKIEVECVTPNLKPVAIMFLESLGGRSTVAFNEVTGMSFNSSYGLTKRHMDPAVNFADYQKEAGFSMVNKRGGASRSFLKVFRITDETLHWVDAFFGASEYHLMHIDTAGSYVWNKFIVTGGSFGIDSYSKLGELSCTGYLANNILSQRGVV